MNKSIIRSGRTLRDDNEILIIQIDLCAEYEDYDRTHEIYYTVHTITIVGIYVLYGTRYVPTTRNIIVTILTKLFLLFVENKKKTSN